MTALLPSTAVHLDAVLARAQVDARMPSLCAAVVREGEVVWEGARGRHVRAGSDAAPGPDTQYRIGSITKSFTAALVLLAREDGLVDLADPLRAYVPDAPFGDATVRALLSHGAGLPAEPAGPWWERSPGVDYERLAEVHRDRGRVLAPGERFHYSNLGYGLLGQLVATVRKRSWADDLEARLLRPLGMSRTTYGPEPEHADGYSIEALTGMAVPEPAQDTGVMAPAGQLWSTTTDLARWLGELAAPQVLSRASVTAMTTPQAADPALALASEYGLGLQVTSAAGRTVVGHGGSMPGFLAGAWVERESGVGVALLANGAYGLVGGPLVATLIDLVLTHEPVVPDPWVPTTSVPTEAREILGTWHWGHQPFVLSYEPGLIRLAAERGRAFTFVPDAPDAWVGVSGYHEGEVLRVARHSDGSVSHLDVGTFCYTRVPYDPAAPIPGAED